MEDTLLDQPTSDTPEPTTSASSHLAAPPPAPFWQAIGRQMLPKIGLFYFGLFLGFLPMIAWKPTDPIVVSELSGVIVGLVVISLLPGVLFLLISAFMHMINRSHSPQPDREQHAMSATGAKSTPGQQRSPGAAFGGCLIAAGITLGLLSIAVSVLGIVNTTSFFDTAHRYYGSYGEATFGLGIFFLVVWLPFGALPGVLSCLCAGVYSLRKISKRRTTIWLLFIGGLAFGLGLVMSELSSLS